MPGISDGEGEDGSGNMAGGTRGNSGNGEGTVVCSGKSGGLEITAALTESGESGGRKSMR